MPDATWPELPLGTNARHHLLAHGWTEADLASLRLVMSLAGRLSSLVNAVGDLGTLKSVLAAQERCDAEPTEPPAKVNGTPVLAANGPGETVHQSMVRAADSGVQVVLTLAVMGETLRHLCKVSYPVVRDDGSVFIVDPELPEQCGAVRTSVRTGDSFPHMPKVVACSPVHLAPDQSTLGLAQPEPLFSTRRRLGELLGLPQDPSSADIIAAVEQLVRGLGVLAESMGVPMSAPTTIPKNLQSAIANLLADVDQASADADRFSKSAEQQRARAAGARDLCAAITEAIDTLGFSDSPAADEAIGLLTRALNRNRGEEFTLWPEPDREGWYWIRANEPDSEWETTRVGRDEQTGALIATYQLVTGLSHHVVWGPRIEPPRNAASPAEVAAP